MLTSALNFNYPESLIATEPSVNFRTMLVQKSPNQQNHSISKSNLPTPKEISKSDIFGLFQKGDVLAINETRVMRRRVTTSNGLEILFLNELHDMANVWEVLFPAKQIKNDESILLPDGVTAKLLERGLPQKIQTSISLTEDYFLKFGELALPPYIQKARGERHNRENEEELYQTAWAKNFGSHASPTASLHFTKEDLLTLKDRGVIIAPLTLHVGIGTFLPIKTVQLSEHKMHGEFATISQSSIEAILRAKEQKHKVWALGTTAVRTLESWAAGKLQAQENGDVAGVTNLFIQPGYKFQVVDNLLTNFHQPGSTLLALVAAFAEHSLNGANGLEVVHAAYQFAIENKFRLFSYGDLSIWMT